MSGQLFCKYSNLFLWRAVVVMLALVGTLPAWAMVASSPVDEADSSRCSYLVQSASAAHQLDCDWDSAFWNDVPVLEVAHFRPESATHHPMTHARLVYHQDALTGIFRVQDQYVRCRHNQLQSPVYQDSCVEFFVQPSSGLGYFNFEFSCCGGLLCSYVIDPARNEDGSFVDFREISLEDAALVRIQHSLPDSLEEDLDNPTIWTLAFQIPLALLEKFAGLQGDLAGKTWRGNFYKCGDRTRYPHWAAWCPVDALNFHLPECFGELHFVP